MSFIQDGRNYMIMNTASGTVIDLAGGSGVPGTVCQGWAPDYSGNNNANETWIFERTDSLSYSYRIRNKKSGLYMDLTNAGKANGTKVIGWDRNNADNQTWYVFGQDTGSSIVRIMNKATGTWLDLNDGGSRNGTKVQGWAVGKPRTDNQKWILISVPTSQDAWFNA